MAIDKSKHARTTSPRGQRILAAQDLDHELLTIPEWDETIRVKACPVGSPRYNRYVYERDEAGHLPVQAEINQRRIAGAAILSAFDPDTDERLFTWEDADALREKHWEAVVRIADKAFELAADEVVEDIDEGKESSGSAQTSD